MLSIAYDAQVRVESVQETAPAGTAAPMYALRGEVEDEGGAAVGDAGGAPDQQYGARVLGGLAEASPGAGRTHDVAGVEVEEDQAEAAGAQEQIGGSQGIACGAGAHPQHARELGAGTGEPFGVQTIGRIDPGDGFAAPCGGRGGVESQGGTPGTGTAGQFRDAPAGKASVEEIVEPCQAGGQPTKRWETAAAESEIRGSAEVIEYICRPGHRSCFVFCSPSVKMRKLNEMSGADDLNLRRHRPEWATRRTSARR